MADKAHIATDKAIGRMQRYVAKIYADAQKSVSAQFARYAAKIQTRADELYDAIKEAKTEDERKAAKLAYKRFFAKEVIRDKDFKKTANEAAETLYSANLLMAGYLNTQTPAIYAKNYNYIGEHLDEDIPDYDFTAVTEEEADKYGNIERQTVNERKDTRWNRDNIVRSVIGGAVLYLGVEAIMRRAARETTRKNVEAANRQISDMATSAENSGRLDSMFRAYDEGFGVKKVWIATLDNRTRETHQNYDGEPPHELDYEYSPGLKIPRDPDCTDLAEVCNCRCRITYNTGRQRSETRAARAGDVTGSYKDQRSFAGTQTYYVRNMSYEEWMKWRHR